MGPNQFFFHYLIFVHGLFLLFWGLYSFFMPRGFAVTFGWSWSWLGVFGVGYGLYTWSHLVQTHTHFSLLGHINTGLLAVSFSSFLEFSRRALRANKSIFGGLWVYAIPLLLAGTALSKGWGLQDPALWRSTLAITSTLLAAGAMFLTAQGIPLKMRGPAGDPVRRGLLLMTIVMILLGLKAGVDVFLSPLLLGHLPDHLSGCVLIFVALFAVTQIHGPFIFEKGEHLWKGWGGEARGFIYLFALLPALAAGYGIVSELSKGGLHLDGQATQRTAEILRERLGTSVHVVRSLDKSMAENLAPASQPGGFSESDLPRINAMLDRYATIVEMSVVYLLDIKGNVVALSNRAAKDSFVGKNYAFRPYFKEALAKGDAEYIAQGVTSNFPGLYISSLMRSAAGEPIGVAVIKAPLRGGLFNEEKDMAAMLVHDSGIILGAVPPGLANKALWPVPEADRKEFLSTKQFPVPEGKSFLSSRPANGEIKNFRTAEALFHLEDAGVRSLTIVTARLPHDFYAWQLWGFAGLLFLFGAGFTVILWNEFLERNNILTLARERDQKALVLQMETIFNSTQVGLLLVDSGFNVKRVNQVVLDMGGQELLSVLGRQPGNALSCIKARETEAGCGGPDACKGCLVRTTASTVFNSGKEVRAAEVGLTIRTAAGEHKEIWLDVNASPLEIKGERHILFSLSDITQRKISDIALRESKARFDELAEHNRVVNWEVDTDGIYTYVNHVAPIVFGYQREELVGCKHFYDLHPEEGREAFKTAALDVFTKKGAFRGLVNPVQHKDGRTVWVATSGRPLLDDKGALQGYRGSDVDITEQKKLEDQRAGHLKTLEVFYKASMGREERILELKNELAALKKEREK